VVSFHASVTLLPPKKEFPLYPMERKLDAAKHYSGHNGKNRTVAFM